MNVRERVGDAILFEAFDHAGFSGWSDDAAEAALDIVLASLDDSVLRNDIIHMIYRGDSERAPEHIADDVLTVIKSRLKGE